MVDEEHDDVGVVDRVGSLLGSDTLGRSASRPGSSVDERLGDAQVEVGQRLGDVARRCRRPGSRACRRRWPCRSGPGRPRSGCGTARSWRSPARPRGAACASLTSRAVRISRDSSGAAPTMNHGSTAMQWPPTPGPGREDVDARVVVGQPDDLPHVEAEVLADQRELVGEGDVDVAVGVLDQLGHLGAGRVGEQDLALAEDAVDLPPPSRRSARVMPPTTRSLVTISIMIRPGSTRSGQCATWKSGTPSEACGATRSGRSCAEPPADLLRRARAARSTPGSRSHRLAVAGRSARRRAGRRRGPPRAPR